MKHPVPQVIVYKSNDAMAWDVNDEKAGNVTALLI